MAKARKKKSKAAPKRDDRMMTEADLHEQSGLMLARSRLLCATRSRKHSFSLAIHQHGYADAILLDLPPDVLRDVLEASIKIVERRLEKSGWRIP